MHYPEELIEEIKIKNDIVDVISEHVKLQKGGTSHFGLCPFHNEKSPSFFVFSAKQVYCCFGCKADGDVFTFVMNHENCSFEESVEILADRAGIKLPDNEHLEKIRKKDAYRAKLFEANREAAQYFHHQLCFGENAGYRYLSERRLTDETIKKFGLGFANNAGNGLTKNLKEKGFSYSFLENAGLSGYNETYGSYDRFWNRIMFPIQDINHRVIGFGGRVMGDSKPKYINSSETPIFDKSKNLYGLNFARSANTGNIILCEGYMDVISMHQAGFTQAVASLGTAFTIEQAKLLKRYTDNVFLAYDSDYAGIKAALRAIEMLEKVGLNCKVIDMKPYKDPDEFLKNLGVESLKERIDNAENGSEFKSRHNDLEKNFTQNR